MSYNNIIVISIILLLPPLLQAQDVWQELIADDLKGCTQFGGDVIYFVKENTIIGETIQNTPNSFLTTDAEYGDFIQKYEVYLDTQINSSVQIRNESNTDYMDGQVHGYQIELDLVARAWSGGFYDEAHRGWLYPFTYIFGTDSSAFGTKGLYHLHDRHGDLVREKSSDGDESGTVLGGGGEVSTRHIFKFLKNYMRERRTA